MNESYRDDRKEAPSQPDYAKFRGVSEAKTSRFVALLDFLRQRPIAYTRLVGSLTSLTLIGCATAKYGERLCWTAGTAVMFVALLVASIGCTSLFKGNKNGANSKGGSDEPPEPGND
jgi:hypothetical protein